MAVTCFLSFSLKSKLEIDWSLCLAGAGAWGRAADFWKISAARARLTLPRAARHANPDVCTSLRGVRMRALHGSCAPAGSTIWAWLWDFILLLCCCWSLFKLVLRHAAMFSSTRCNKRGDGCCMLHVVRTTKSGSYCDTIILFHVGAERHEYCGPIDAHTLMAVNFSFWNTRVCLKVNNYVWVVHCKQVLSNNNIIARKLEN